jgi:hypothetical protein
MDLKEIGWEDVDWIHVAFRPVRPSEVYHVCAAYYGAHCHSVCLLVQLVIDLEVGRPLSKDLEVPLLHPQ